MASSWKLMTCRNIAKRASSSITISATVVKPQETHISAPEDADLSLITPQFQKSFNIAAYVNNSETLKKFVDLKVNLSKIEKKPSIAEKLLKLNFEKNVKAHIMFLNDHVSEEQISRFITKNPMIFYETIEDLQVRVNYLTSKRFSNEQIKLIVTKNPFWLMFRYTCF